MEFDVRVLGAEDTALMDGMLTMFGEAFGEVETYGAARPSAEYTRRLLAGEMFIAIGAVVGGIAAYELRKFEQERSEIYIYDLAVAEAWRRRGVASAMIERLREVARQRGVYVIYVQADLVDDAAIALYTKFGRREDVLHFDIEV